MPRMVFGVVAPPPSVFVARQPLGDFHRFSFFREEPSRWVWVEHTRDGELCAANWFSRTDRFSFPSSSPTVGWYVILLFLLLSKGGGCAVNRQIVLRLWVQNGSEVNSPPGREKPGYASAPEGGSRASLGRGSALRTMSITIFGKELFYLPSLSHFQTSCRKK